MLMSASEREKGEAGGLSPRASVGVRRRWCVSSPPEACSNVSRHCVSRGGSVVSSPARSRNPATLRRRRPTIARRWQKDRRCMACRPFCRALTSCPMLCRARRCICRTLKRVATACCASTMRTRSRHRSINTHSALLLRCSRYSEPSATTRSRSSHRPRRTPLQARSAPRAQRLRVVSTNMRPFSAMAVVVAARRNHATKD
jgi:hypothetical protein